MAIDKNVGGVNEVAQSLIDEFKSLAKDMHNTGEDMSEEIMKGISQGVKKHSKEVKSEIAKIFEDFNRMTNNFKSRKSVSSAEWQSVLRLSEELLKSDRYADSVRDKLSGIAVTFKNIGKVSGIDNVVKELAKAEHALESVQWSEAGKNYKKKATIKKTRSSSKPTTADPTPVVDAEKTKQKEVVKTTEAIKEETEAQQKLNAAQKEADNLAKQKKSEKTNIDGVTGAIKKQSDAIEKATKNMLNMESVVKRYNKLMIDLGVDDLTIGMRLSQDTEGWGIKEMVEEAKNQLANFYNPEHDSYIKADGLTDDILKRMKSDIGKLKRFIAAYEPYVDAVENTAPAIKDIAEAAEKQTDTLHEQEKAAKSAAETTSKQNKILISSYQELYDALKKVVELSKQLKPEQTAEFSDMQTLMDMASHPDSKDSLVASIKAQYDNVQRIKSSTKNGLSVYKDIDGYGYEATRSIEGDTLKNAEDMLRAYIYQAVEFFGYTVTDVMNDFSQKRVRSFIEKTMNQYLDASSKNDEYRADTDAFNAPIKEVIDSITSTILGMATDSKNMERVLDTLYELKSRAEDVNRYTLSSQANTIGSKIGINTPYDEIQANVRKIESYEELCEVVSRYNELQKNAIIFGGNDRPGLSEAEEMERRTLSARLEATGGKDIYKLSGFDGFRDVEKLANVLGIEMPKAIEKAEVAQAEFTEETKNTTDAQKQLNDTIESGQPQSQTKTIGQHLVELENITGLTITEVLSDYDNLDSGVKEKVNSILQSMGLMNDQMELTFSKSRGGNAKAVIGNDFVILQKSIETSAEYSENLINKLNEARQLGINVAPVLERVFSTLPENFNSFVNDLYTPGYEVQTRASGKDIHINQRAAGAKDLNKALEENRIILSAADEQLIKFINDYIKLDNLGIEVDPNPFNFLYDAEKGFSFIDLSLKKVDKEAKTTYSVFKEMTSFLANTAGFNALGQDDTMGISSGQIVAKIADAFETIGLATRDELDKWTKGLYDGFGTIYDGYTTGSLNTKQATDIKNESQARKDNADAIHKETEALRIKKEIQGQIDAYTLAATNLLDSGYESVSSDVQGQLFMEFANKIANGSMSAAEAMDQLYASLEKLRSEAGSMPDDVIDNFGADSEKVQETVSQLQKLSSIDATRIFDSVDLKGFLEALNIDSSNFAIFRTLFEELMQITKAMSDGVDVGNAFNLKMEEITNTIMKLGGHMVDIDDDDYATMLQKFYRYMSGVKVQFNDKIKADYTKDQWKSLYNTYKHRLTSDLTKGIPADTLYGELSSPKMFAGLFDSDVWDQQGQFKLIFEKLDEARQLQANNWQTLQGFVSSDRSGIQSDVDDMYNKMSNALFAESSAQQLDAEADALKDVEQSATKAANAKGKFSKENKKLGAGAAESADHLDEEADNLDEVNRAAAQMPDMSAYDSASARLDADGNPYMVSGTARTEMEDGLHYRTTDTYQFDAENNRWDLLGSVQSSERTREMVQALQEYYKILNKVQKLRLDPSNAVHAEEINKLETEDLVRAYQRVSDLGIQVNDIEGQINLSVNQRQALLDVELRARQEMYDVIAKMEDKQSTAAVKPYQKTTSDELKKSSKIDSNIRLLGDGNVSTQLQSQVAQYRRLVDELVDLRLQLARDPELVNDADFSSRFTDTANRAERARAAIEGVFKESQKLSKIGKLKVVSDTDVSNVDNLKAAMISFANSTWDGEVKIQGFNKEGTQMYATLNQGTGAVENITVALDKATGHLNAFSTGTSKATNEWEDFKKQAVSGIARTAGMYLGFNDLIRYGRQGLEYVKDIDLAMTELKKVTDETDASYKEFLGDAGETASVIGSTISDFTEASATFARLGYSLEDSSSMAETAIIYKNVADGLDTVEESSDSIISTMMAFGIEANDTMSIIDRFNAVGNNFAITSAGIGEAMQRSASALFSAGNTIDESVALITAANSVIQNPEQVGTALKTLALRLRGTKTELEEAGEDVEGMAENTSELQAKLKALTHGKVDIMLDANTFKSTTQILREMSAAWEDMNDIERASALELMGGKRQANILSSVITNFETVEDVITTSMESSGSAIAENEKWIDSIEGKTYQFTNALQTMWSNMLDSEMIKGFLDFGTDTIQFLDTGAGKAIAFVAAMKLLAKFKGFSLGGIAQGLGDTIKNINKAQQTLASLKSVMPGTEGLSTQNIQQYANVVSSLTPKYQAQMLAAQGLTKQQIQLAMQYNKVSDEAIREATAHIHVKTAKEQEAVANQTLITEQTRAMAASYRNNALTLQGASASQAAAAANLLEEAACKNLSKAELYELVVSSQLEDQTKQEIIAKLGLAAANNTVAASAKGVVSTLGAIISANPIGFIMTVISVIAMAVNTVDNAKNKVVEAAKEAEDAIKSLNDEFKSDSKTVTEYAERFAELAQGVDMLTGKNLSLTTDDYEEFLDLSNQLADIFPTLSRNYDENGNAIVQLSGDTDTMVGSLKSLLDVQRQITNQQIAENLPDLYKGVHDKSKSYNTELDDLESRRDAFVQHLKNLQNDEFVNSLNSSLGSGVLSITDINDIGVLDSLEEDYLKMLKNLGLSYEYLSNETDKQGNIIGFNYRITDFVDGSMSEEEIAEAKTKIAAGISELAAAYSTEINNLNTQIQTTANENKANWGSMLSGISSWLSTDSSYQILNDEMQSVVQQMVNNIDFSNLEGFDTWEKMQEYIQTNIISKIQSAGPAVQNAFAQLFKIDVDTTTADYIKKIQDKAQEIANSSDFTYDEVLKNTGYDDIIKQYETSAQNILDVLDDNIPKYYEQYEAGTGAHLTNFKRHEREVLALKDKIYSLSPDDMTRAFDIIKKYGITTWDELQEALESKTFDVVLNYDKEKEGMDKLLSTIDESISATGLSEESISNLQSRYQDLENYDPSRLFEKTANGIHLNVQALRELEDEYQKSYKDDLKEQLKGQIQQYQNLTKKINECSNASERATLYSQRQSVLDQIKDTAELASKFDGLTSAYYKWQNAQSNGNERDIYEDIISGKESMDELMSRGWIDDEVRAYIDLLSGKDLSTESYEEVLAAYKELNKEIGNSGHNIYDFFTKDKDGNSTTEGIFNFFDAVRSEMGETFAWIDENGKYNFDFGVGGDQEIAKKFGMDIEAVQAILRAASDAGFEINIDSVYSLVDGLQESTFSAEEATQKLKGLKLISDDIEFNFATEDADNLNVQIEAAQKAVDQLVGDGVELDLTIPGAVEAQTTLAILLQRKNELSEPTWINLDYSKVDDTSDAADRAMLAFRNFYEAYNNHEINVKCGVDTETLSASEEEVQKYINEIKELVQNNPDLKAQIESTLNIQLDTVTPEAFAAALANAPEEEIIKLLPDGTLVEGFDVDPKTGEVFYNVGTDPSNPKDVNTWTPPTKYGTVVYTASNMAGYVLDKIFGGGNADGTAHVSGTAYAGGSWGASETETSLVGELGPEILVRNGRWTTVGEDGAEFTQVKKGDIIFNHKQTESLLKNGHVTGRGRAYVGGTAFSDGVGPGRYTVQSASIAGSAKDAADEFREVFDWIAVRLEEINDDIDYKHAQLENIVGATNQNNKIDEIIDLNQKLYDNLTAGAARYYSYAEKLLAKVPEEYREAAKNGTIAIEEFVGEVDEETLNAIKEYRDWVQKGDDATKQAEETLTEIANLAAQAIKNIGQEYDNKGSIPGGKQDQLDAYNELAEAKYGSESAEIYKEKIKLNDEQGVILANKRDDMQAKLNEKVESGEIEKYSQAWYDAVNDIAAVDTEIINLQTDTEKYKDAITDIGWEHFDNEISRIQSVSKEADNLLDILSNKDMVDDSGNWTADGITSLGLYAQKMEAAEAESLKYQSAINDLNENWQEMGYTEQEYLEKLDELKDGQYDAVKSYEDSKQAIVDLNKERINAIKDGIDKEIDAYKELIDAKKEELDAEKDLHDFQKSVMDQQKDIADIERQLAALAGDNSASARAKRAQLEAELAEKKANLEETYYDRSVSNQQDALDKEMEDFQDAKDKEKEILDESLKDTEKVVGDSYTLVQSNTDDIVDTLADTAGKYGLSVSDSITDPWESGSNAIQNYSDQFGDSSSATTEELQAMEEQYKSLQSAIESFGTESVETTDANFENYQKAIKAAQEQQPEQNQNQQQQPQQQEETIKVGEKIDASGAKIYDYAGDTSGENQYYSKDPVYVVLEEKDGYLKVRHHKLSSGTTGWFKKADVKAYAKGSKGVDKDQLALIDELGEELVLHAQNGRLTYLEKGSGVVPADLTSNLMEWGKLDPSIMLDQNRPQIGVHPEIHNTQIQIDNSVGELIHIDKCDQSTLPDVEKIVNNALEKHTQRLNQSLRKYTR